MIKFILVLLAVAAVCAYAFFLFVLPGMFDSAEKVQKYESFLSSKLGAPVYLKGFDVVTYPNLSFKIASDNIFIIPKDGTDLLHCDKVSYRSNIFNPKHGKLDSEYIYADIEALRKYLKFKPKKKSRPLKLSFYPKINIKEAKIKFNDKNYAEIDYIKSKKHKGKIITDIYAVIHSNYARNLVIIGEKGSIEYEKHLGFDNFSVKFGASEFYLSGDKNGMKITGDNLPAGELESGFLYFYKLTHPNKRNFLENFSDFKGTMDVDLFLDKNGLTGNCVTHNLGANFTDFKIAVFLPETVFNFKGREVSAETKGTFGGEPVKTDFYLTGMMTDDLHVKGNVSSIFTNKITKKYFPAVKISGIADANVKYHTHNTRVDVYYTLGVPKGNNLLSDWGNLDNTDKYRLLKMHTVKDGDPMKIESWSYVVKGADGTKNILTGDGNFEKINGRYTLSDFSVKTYGKISVDYIKSFLRNYVQNGTFDANLRLDILKKVLAGYVNFYNISHDDFLYLKNTGIKIDKNRINVVMDGSFYSSPIKMSASVANRFSEDILIHSIDVHLNEFLVQKGKFAGISQSFHKNKSPQPAQSKSKIRYTVEQGRVIVDRIYADIFDVRNVNIQGSLRNNIAAFIIPKADYAKGLLSAKGMYNLSNTHTDIEFFASDIDSNQVMTEFFKLPNQVEGKSYATLHAIMDNKLNDIKAKATFAISDGYMPQIASKEFLLGRRDENGKKRGVLSRLNIKLTLPKIVNLDFSNMEEYSANIYGTFDMTSDSVKNVKMFAKGTYVGMYIEGDYDIPTESGVLNIWGKRNKTWAKGIRVFKIPLNLLYRFVFRPEHSALEYDEKIKLIPQIKESITDEISIFRVRVSGYFNKKSGLKFELKDLR